MQQLETPREQASEANAPGREPPETEKVPGTGATD
jgi:hypothetical protein